MKHALRQRLRLRYRKDEILKYISHRDLLRYIFRLLRRAEIPFATSGYYSPKPRVSFGPALPLGVTADSELADIELVEGLTWSAAGIAAATARLAEAAQPRDFRPALTALARTHPPLARQAVAARYRIDFAGGADALPAVLKQGPLTLKRADGRSRDLREAILRYTVSNSSVTIDGGVVGDRNLSVVRLADLLKEQAAAEWTALHRLCLLDEKGEPL